MRDNREQFHNSDRKRLILIADDEIINREMLAFQLSEHYRVLQAGDGAETMRLIRENRDTLSIVLLDLLMPNMNGFDVLRQLREEPGLSDIPVIVITAEKDEKTEVECLNLGAIDFLPKPYPKPEVAYARIQRTIELFEDRNTIESTQLDELTGLYTREFFYYYAEQFDQFHPDVPMDAVILDVNHFHILNERYGKAYGDEVLRRLGERIGNLAQQTGGTACRREADTFMLYCPRREDYQELLDSLLSGLTEEDQTSNRIRLRMGIYPDADRAMDIERRFDRAKMAADSVQGSFTRTIGIYNAQMHADELYAEQLIEEFPRAIAEGQFRVFYQPKFDIRPDTPVLASAEALVRWQHPTLGMISPGVFIPLFEDNGLIQQLDHFVWREAARQFRVWKETLGFCVPISVNVSRIDMYDPRLIDTLTSLTSEYGLNPRDLMLEVTESAYTQDSVQIIETVRKLRELGFMIEMDDFGTGYSSLNMISALPIDALKLDMQFIRSAFREGGNTHMLQVIISIARHLMVPVIAEGVETQEQLDSLKKLDCDIVQGYFFSRPVPADEFAPFLIRRKEELESAPERGKAAHDSDKQKLREIISPADSRTDGQLQHGQEEEAAVPRRTASRSGVQLRRANILFTILAFLAAAFLLLTDLMVTRGYQRMSQASDRYIAVQIAAGNLESASDYLTDCVRSFVVTGETDYLKDYFEEVNVTRRRDTAVEKLEMLPGSASSEIHDRLNRALSLSNDLIERERYAMHLILENGNDSQDTVPGEVLSVELTPEDRALSQAERREKAISLVFGGEYVAYKEQIRENVSLCTQALITSSAQELDQASKGMVRLMHLQTGMTILLLAVVLAIVILVSTQVRKPLTQMVEKMQAQEIITPTGVEELRFVTRTYNAILHENLIARERLSHEASHDALTGLFNRGAYELFMDSVDTSHMAMILIDVDYFKQVNDTYGHAVGDRILKRVAETLRSNFRSVDILCRLGGDEFVVIMTRVNSSMQHLVVDKIRRANETLQHPQDDLPPTSLSVGIAFSDRKNPQGDIFHDADIALYRVKEAGRNGCAVYE